MTKQPLGKLESVDLREHWMNESIDFTPWLATDENIKLLSEVVNMDLEVECTEKDVGPYKADILCKDNENDSIVLIENQLEITDHKHLGQIFTYAAGLEAVTIIWIAKQFTDEHRAAIQWLNEISQDKFNFFAIEIELWKIGDSPYAPKFNIVVKPNEWKRSFKRKEGLSEKEELRYQFWSAFKEYMRDSHLRCTNPNHKAYMRHTIGISGFYLSSVIVQNDRLDDKVPAPLIRVKFTISMKDKSKECLLKLKERQEEIEKAIGEELIWFHKDDVERCSVFLSKSADYINRDDWKNQFSWLRENLEKFHKVFFPIVRNL